MSTPRQVTTSAVELPPDAGPAPAPIPTPTVTHYQQLADSFSNSLDQIAATIPQLEGAHPITANFVRSHQNVPMEFLATAIAAVEQTPELRSVNKLDIVAARDSLQFIEAFRPVLDKVGSLHKKLRFTIDTRKADLAADSLQIYSIAKGLSRDAGATEAVSIVANLKRDLGRRGRPKGAAAAAKASSQAAPAPKAVAAT